MVRPVIALAMIAACSGACRSGPAGQTENPGANEPLIIKRVAVSWGIEKAPPGDQGETMTDVFLATTDETGKQVSHPLGRYKGDCAVIAAAPEMNALTAVACRTGGTGTELQAVVQHGEDIVVLKLGIDQGVRSDPMAREEVTRIKVPRGAKIELGG